MIAAGGGVVVTEANRELLDEPDVTVVWLDGEPAFLALRVAQKANKAHRPLLDDDPARCSRASRPSATAWYAEVADVVVDVGPAHEAGEKPKWSLAEQVVERPRRSTSRSRRALS